MTWSILVKTESKYLDAVQSYKVRCALWDLAIFGLFVDLVNFVKKIKLPLFQYLSFLQYRQYTDKSYAANGTRISSSDQKL